MGTSVSNRQLERHLERRTHAIGMRFFDEIEASAPPFWHAEWWEEQGMQQMMQDEWLKVQAFRFIDVLPALQTRNDIARHLSEYFVHPAMNGGGGSPPEKASWLVPFFGRAMRFRRYGSPIAHFWSWLAKTSAETMAHRFLAGQTPRQAEQRIRKLRDRSLAFSVDVLGEAAVSEKEAEHYASVYHDLIIELPRHAENWPAEPLVDIGGSQPIPRVNVSVKLTSLYSQFDPIDPQRTKQAVKDRLRPLLRTGMANGVHVHIDMEHYAIKDLTLEICREVFCEPEFRDYPHFGLVLQAYLVEGDADVADTVAWVRKRGAPIWVRLVKGAYWDTETVLAEQWRWPCPVWQQKWQSDACFERMARVLIENSEHTRGAFASHNIRSLSYAMALAEEYGLDGSRFELQMLYGMADPLKRAAVAMNKRCRVYTPYGELLPGMAYLIRRLLENTSNESFLRLTVDESTPRDALLAQPGPPTSGSEESPAMTAVAKEIDMREFTNVPDTDFSRPENRDRMVAALQQVRGELDQVHPLVIDGQHIRTDELLASCNPARPAEVIGRVCMADDELTDRCVAAAATAFKTWRHVSVPERAEYLFNVARQMEARRFELSALACLECAKPWREADADISEAIDFCNYYGREMMRLEAGRRRDVPGETNEYFYTPRGVVAVIAPWNFPLAILTGMATAALVTGNTVIMKPAEQSMVIAARLMEMFEQAGIPKGVLNFLPGTGETVGARLVEHAGVNMIIFTGSRQVGCWINQRAAATITAQPGLKRVVAEMGGKNATIIDSDADLDEAVHGVLYSAFGFAGQKCSAGSRAIVLADVHDRFVERLVEATRSIQVGPAEAPGTFVPPVIDETAAENIRRYIEIGRQESTCAIEVDVSELVRESGGSFVGPAVFTDVTPDARIAQEEIFGPVVAVIKARDLTQAIEIFNGTDYALTGGIYSRSPASLERARQECDCGNFYINRKITGALVDQQPFGGFKMSGMGSKAGGPDYLLQFCEPRTITENTLRRGFAPSEEIAEVLG